MNSRVSRQWFCDKYAVNALRVQGGGAVFDNISARVGTLMAGEPARGMPKLFGLDCDMVVSTSQSPRTEDGGDMGVGLGDGVRYVGEILRSLDFPIFRMRLKTRKTRGWSDPVDRQQTGIPAGQIWPKYN